MTGLNTQSLFLQVASQSTISPLSEFHLRLYAINRLAPQPTEFLALHAQVLLLGVVASVESYFRSAIRRSILLDAKSREAAASKSLPLGAAMAVSFPFLPEVALEEVTFSSPEVVWEAAKTFMGIKGEQPLDIVAASSHYAKVCQLRHCSVHRFGKLGPRNAVKLGVADHAELIDGEMNIGYGQFQILVEHCTVFVRSYNNLFFNELISRRSDWTWNYNKDRRNFRDYYALFADTESSDPTIPQGDLYRAFRSERNG